ncbi:MAG: HDOD domain-containing protein [candidate division Zixibacteria bacterium]|nr:HDOD domain-containing protein [candidate division Zixibacteria bacterium]
MTTETMDNKVIQVVSNIRNLPTPPIVFHQIQKVIKDPNVSAGQIASILSEDPAMSVKVLKLTNSAFYGLSREVESVKQAVVIVGLEAIKNLVLSASVLDMFKGKDIDQEFQEKFWRHSLATAFCARILARKLKSRGIVDPDLAFSAGLLHDIGKMVLCCFLQNEYKKFNEARLTDQQSQTFELEEKALGYNHSQIGALLAVQWKLPSKIGEAITFHHSPQKNVNEDPTPYLICIANYIAKKTFYEKDETYLIGSLAPEIYAFLDFHPENEEEYCELLRQEYLKSETFMQMVGIGG